MNIIRCYELFLTDRKISACSEAAIRFYESVIGKLVRFVRTGVLEVLSEDYVLVARSKGLHGPRFLLKHVLPGALIPVVTLIGVQLAALLGGTIVVEQVFARPGIGRLLMDAIYVL